MRTYKRPTRTVQLGNRDKPAPRLRLSSKPTVSGSGSPEPICENPADSREFLGLSFDLWGKSLQPQTQWRSERDSNFRFGSREFAKPGRELACRISRAIRSTKPNHRNGRQRQTRQPARIAPEQARLWFGIERPRLPRPRGIAGFSGSILGSKREVSAAAD